MNPKKFQFTRGQYLVHSQKWQLAIRSRCISVREGAGNRDRKRPEQSNLGKVPISGSKLSNIFNEGF